MTRILPSLSILFIITFSGCATQRVSTISTCDYDESKNGTDYFEFPFGSVSIPGKWKESNYNSISGQQFFTNDDSIRIAIAFNRFDKYEFNVNGSKKGYDFAEAFYEWDSEFFVNSRGLERRIIENDSINNYFLYQIYGLTKGAIFDLYFIVGEKNGNVKNLSIMTTDKWTQEKKIEFLKELYLSN